jgi:glycosyltransferase involved in cell wall biosynthesis
LNPLFSIVIPTYNSEENIEFLLRDLLSQTFEDFEILVIDGCSTDYTIEKAQNVQDGRIKIISEKDLGIYDAMNKGIVNASGKWLYFLGSDDKLFNDSVLSKVSKHLEGQNVVYGNVKINGDTTWSKDGQIYDGEFDFEKLFNRNICHQAVFYNSEFIKGHQFKFNLEYTLCSDWDLNLRCRSITEFLYVDLIIAEFNAGGLSTKTDLDNLFSRDMVSNLISYFKLSPFDPLLDNPDFIKYHQVLGFQKKDNPLRYFMRKIFRRGVLR